MAAALRQGLPPGADLFRHLSQRTLRPAHEHRRPGFSVAAGLYGKYRRQGKG